MTRPRYVAAAALDRATALRPVARLREYARAAGAPRVHGPAEDGLPIPPARLRVLVGSTDPAQFLAEGRAAAAAISRAVEVRGSVLDFGCGCGRTARHWAGRELDLHGCDINPRGVAWVNEHLPFVQARTNQLEPPAPYPDATFDVVYAISILTHLTEMLAEQWIADWRRVLKPGGTLVVTTHGDRYRDALGRRAREHYDAGEVVVKAGRIAGLNACVAHHPEAAMRRLLADFDDVVHHAAGTTPGFPQDVWAATRS
jgi:SAM-dependent methyltransferase